MAIFDVEFPSDFLSDLLDTEFDEIAEAALTDAAPLLEIAMKGCCEYAIMHEGDSELVESIEAGTPKKTKKGDAWIVNVAPRGYSLTKQYTAEYRHRGRKRKTNRKYPVSNALKAIWKEYGIPGIQPPSPFLERACNNVRDMAIARMQEVYNRKVGAE